MYHQMLRIKRRIGFYGGTFDPFHSGHLKMARAAADRLDLHRVCFVPTSQNPLKGQAPTATPVQRVEMIRRGIEGESAFTVWEGELERPGPGYTLDTVRHVEQVYPNCHLFWIIGSDQLPYLSQWHGIGTLVQKIRFILMQRPGFDLEWPCIPGLFLYPVDNPLSPISATDIRRRLKDGKSLRGLVPDTVAEYIKQQGFYI